MNFGNLLFLLPQEFQKKIRETEKVSYKLNAVETAVIFNKILSSLLLSLLLLSLLLLLLYHYYYHYYHYHLYYYHHCHREILVAVRIIIITISRYTVPINL